MKSGEIPTSCLGHEFSNKELLRAALTHRSAGQLNNERLEYLGDAVLGFIIAEALYKHFPEASEGSLTRLRANLVKRETLAHIARNFNLGDQVVLGSGELKSGGWRRDSILANAMEAVIGAIYLDTGFEACRRRLLEIYAPLLESCTPETIHKDPKTALQEFMQARQLPLPVYRVVDESGEAHDREFTVECEVAGLKAAVSGSGRSKQSAEQAAAQIALSAVQEQVR